MNICPSAMDGVNIPELLQEIMYKEIYKSDYISITEYFQRNLISYEEVITALEIIVDSRMFETNEVAKIS